VFLCLKDLAHLSLHSYHSLCGSPQRLLVAEMRSTEAVCVCVPLLEHLDEIMYSTLFNFSLISFQSLTFTIFQAEVNLRHNL